MSAGRPPVIIIGMHRSGTSMIARMLESLGLFQGWQKQGDHEPVFFLSLNDWLLSHCQAGWDNPEPVRHLIDNDEVCGLAADYLQLCMRGPEAIRFLGPGRYLRHRDIGALAEPWGWKDPRATFTLPVWARILPRFRLIHVLRHGVDVANSLRVRHESIVAGRHARYAQKRWTYAWRSKRPLFTTSVRCATLEDGFDLWELYTRQARAQIEAQDVESLEIRYEDFLAQPESGLRELAKLCALEVDDARIRELVRGADADRAYAHRRSPELLAFSESRVERLASQGY